MSIGARGFASPRRIRPSAGAANTARRTPATKTNNPSKMHRFKNADWEPNFLFMSGMQILRERRVPFYLEAREGVKRFDWL
jgi:hypothetical protein